MERSVEVLENYCLKKPDGRRGRGLSRGVSPATQNTGGGEGMTSGRGKRRMQVLGVQKNAVSASELS